MYQTWEELEEACKNCNKCKLCANRHNVVIGTGNRNAKIMFIGEGPGADEDLQGIPFVGKAGKLMDRAFEGIEIKREEVYIANIVKCRPPNNRNPEYEEADACKEYLESQINLVKPEIIILLGSVALKNILGKEYGITSSRGKWFEKDGIKCVAYVRAFLQVYVDYYEYKNPLITGDEVLFTDYFGKGGFDPFVDGYEYDSMIEENAAMDDISEIIVDSEDEKIDNENIFSQQEKEDDTAIDTDSDGYPLIEEFQSYKKELTTVATYIRNTESYQGVKAGDELSEFLANNISAKGYPYVNIAEHLIYLENGRAMSKVSYYYQRVDR